jgi:hypothetical protein
MPVAYSPAPFINSSKGCPFITESFPLVVIFITGRHRRGIASGATPLCWIFFSFGLTAKLSPKA